MNTASRLIYGSLLIALLAVSTTGCATAPKPKTVGQTIGSAIDKTIVWSSKGIRKILNK